MAKKSLSLEAKINKHFKPDSITVDLDSLIETMLSPNCFKSKQDLKDYLSEGALLNISAIGSHALSVPCGEHMVWVTDVGHTVLVPVNDARKPTDEVFEQKVEQYEVLTHNLLNHYNKVERVLAESFDNQNQTPNQATEQADQNNQYDDGGNPQPIPNQVDVSTVDRHPILRAMEDRGFTVTSLAAEVGVDPPAISRILRTPKDTQGDPGGRNPSIGLASQICSALRIDPASAFPDIFKTNTSFKPEHGASHSGDGERDRGMAEAAKSWIALTEEIEASGLTVPEFWNHYMAPALDQATSPNIVEFVTGLQGFSDQLVAEGLEDDINRVRHQEGGNRGQYHPTTQSLLGQGEGPAVEDPLATPKAIPRAIPVARPLSPADATYRKRLEQNKEATANHGTPNYDQRLDQKRQEVTSFVLQPLRREFFGLMKNYLQRATGQNFTANGKYASIAHQLVNKLYNQVMPAAAKILSPDIQRAKPGQTPSHRPAYDTARSAWQGNPQGV